MSHALRDNGIVKHIYKEITRLLIGTRLLKAGHGLPCQTCALSIKHDTGR
jgi:hypothetical protein